MILEEGFACNGQTFGSLSQIAKAMTGTNWNGHRFFGLRQGSGRRARALVDADVTVGELNETISGKEFRDGRNKGSKVPSAPTFYVVPGSTVKRVIDDNRKQVISAVRFKKAASNGYRVSLKTGPASWPERRQS